jgi:hypothetical protein
VSAAATIDQDSVGPGLAGFLVMFALAIAVVLLVRSMVGHLRKVRYGPGPDGLGPGGTDPDGTEPGRTERDGTEPGRTEPGRTEPDRARAPRPPRDV